MKIEHGKMRDNDKYKIIEKLESRCVMLADQNVDMKADVAFRCTFNELLYITEQLQIKWNIHRGNLNTTLIVKESED